MKINEVEKLLQISAKAIRLYEERGLITVSRDSGGYRIYSDDNIERLKEIKLYREMGVSLKDIKNYFDGKQDIIPFINKQIEDIKLLEERKLIYQRYVKECEKDKKDVNGCLEALAFLHTDDYEELKYRTLGGQIGSTIMLSMPVLYCLLIPEEISLPLYVVSLIVVIIFTLSWINFIKVYEFTKENMIRDLKTALKKVTMVVLFVITGVMLFMFFQFLQAEIFLSKNFILLQFKYPYIYLPFIIFIEILIVLGALFNRRKEMLDIGYMNKIYDKMKKYYKGVIFINLFILYVCITSIVVITDEKITDYSFYNPFGQTYLFQEVEEVETGFRGNEIGIIRTKGDFYYSIAIQNGPTLTIEMPYANEKRYQDTYEEFLELDALIMKHDVSKILNDRYQKYASLDQKYINIMLTVINNK